MSRIAKQLVAELERTRAETLGYFALGEVDLSKTYGPGKWSVGFILRHLADSEQILYERICRTIAEPRQTMAVFQESLWADKLDYANVPLEIARGMFESVRRATIHHAGRFYESHGHLEFVHTEMGVRTLKQEFDKVAAHNENHLKQIRTALGRNS
jgi:hypothetical protein